MAKRTTTEQDEDGRRRKYLSQADVPAFGLEQALRVARTLADEFGKNPARPLRVAEAMNMQPSSSKFRMLCGASIAYGLTEGGYNSEQIALTPLGRRAVAPTQEGDDEAAKREALLRPRVVRDFLSRYNGAKLPSENVGRNVLDELGVPSERTAEVLAFITESAQEAGYVRTVKGNLYVDLFSEPSTPGGGAGGAGVSANTEPAFEPAAGTKREDEPEVRVPTPNELPATSSRQINRVFITHGKNLEIVSQLKDLLTFGKFVPVVALEQETVSKPVPDKVMDEMRSCSAAIIHVGAEQRLLDPNGREHAVLNPNVLIEIGAAMALYGGKFILLVEKDVSLPSNLQGLYEVRYTGGKLDYDATMKLLKAFNDFRS
jgi:predicted nucleotide-binding protein